MYKKHIVVIILYLTTLVSSEVQQSESKNATFVEGPTNATKVIEKRQSISIAASADGEGSPIGLNSLVIQIVGGLLQNTLSGKGLTAQALGSIINLLNPESIKQDLLLVRRAFSIFARLGLLINRYLPNPALSGNSFKPLDLLSSKVRFYAPESPENVHWIAVNRNSESRLLADVPERVKMMVDFATQKPSEASTLETPEPSGGSETTAESNKEDSNAETSTKNSQEDHTSDKSVSVVEKEINDETSNNQNTPLEEAVTVEEENTANDDTSSNQNTPSEETVTVEEGRGTNDVTSSNQNTSSEETVTVEEGRATNDVISSNQNTSSEVNITVEEERTTSDDTSSNQNTSSEEAVTADSTVEEGRATNEDSEVADVVPAAESKPDGPCSIQAESNDTVKQNETVQVDEPSSNVTEAATGKPEEELSSSVNPNQLQINSNTLQEPGRHDLPAPVKVSSTFHAIAQGYDLPPQNNQPNPYLLYGIPAVGSKPSGLNIEAYDSLLAENDNNKRHEAYRLPSESGDIFKHGSAGYELPTQNPNNFDVISNKLQGFKEHSLSAPVKSSTAFKPEFHNQYGVPKRFFGGQIYTDNHSGRRRGGYGLPSQYDSEVYSGLPLFDREPHFPDNGLSNDNFGSIAEIPLEHRTIYDRRRGDLRDSFGFPVRH